MSIDYYFPFAMGFLCGVSVVTPFLVHYYNKQEELKEESLGERMVEERAESEKTIFENEDIYFEFDSITITPASQEILTKKGKWLRENSTAIVTIEGHCDSRGTNEYNLALGEKRAKSTLDYLASLGIAANRVEIISYGKSQPIDLGHNEVAWQKNRRAQFTIIAK